MQQWEDGTKVLMPSETVSPKLINCIINSVLENDEFWSNFDGLLSNYIQARKENKRTHPSEISSIDAARFSLNRLFGNLIDDVYESLYARKKVKPLFPLEPEQPRKTDKQKKKG